MPDLDWKAFRALPGAPWRNWELLCHGLIQRNYGRFGNLVAVRVQPVVEFHLTLTEDCPLGARGEQWGWQCKFWDDDKPKLSSSRKTVIAKAFKDQPTVLPDLDHLVIWTHQALREADWTWIAEHAPDGLDVQTWWDDQVANLLTGDAAPLRETYFETAVVVPSQLAAAYDDTKATLHGLLPEIHVTVREERALQKLRGRAADWPEIIERADRLAAVLAALEDLPPSSLGATYTDVTFALAGEAEQAIEAARGVAAHLESGLTFKASELAEQAPPPRDELARRPVRDLEAVLGRVGEHGHRSAVADLSATLAASTGVLETLARRLRMPLVAVEGGVGAGKTQLAARVAAPLGADPAGAIVPARSFRSPDIDLDRMAGFAGLAARPIDDLLEALDAAGGRAGQRLPLVIDGLHESLAAPEWRDNLARLISKVKRYNNVYVVVTVRPTYVQDCVPVGSDRMVLRGFQGRWRVACERYFDLYKIRAELDLLPAARFSEPLFLRVFCEAINPQRAEWVDLGTVPPSLVEALEQYLVQAVERIRVRLRLDPLELHQRLRDLAMAFWMQDTRTLPLKEAKRIVGDDPLALDTSVTYGFEGEGVLDRDRSPDGGETFGPMFDALGGYLIADAILPNGQSRDAALAAIDGRLVGPNAHPLAEDIRRALGHLFVRRAHVALREAAIDPVLQRAATLDLLTADPVAVTAEDAAAVSDLIAGGEALGDQWRTVILNRAVTGHPFNALWLDGTLRRLGVAQRDLDWTEALRANAEDLTAEIMALTGRWREGVRDQDELELRWLAWVLTSTDRALRDRATEAIYWFGRHDPATLHALTLELLDVNDRYVPERLMAACYGVAMANQIASPAWRAAAPALLDALDVRLVTGGGGVDHWLLREYALGIRRLVCNLHPDIGGGRKPLSEAELPLSSQSAEALGEGDGRYDEARRVLGMDFHNYTLGRLVEGRGNYDFKHAGHKQVVAEVLGRVWDLGWRDADFADIDRDIAHSSSRRHDLDPDRIDRYGKKYAWIGYYEAAGRRAHAQMLPRGRLADVDIDPSFPQAPPPAPIALPSWVEARHKTDENWVKGGRVEFPDELLVAETLGDARGPWVCLDGYLRAEDEASGRKVFLFVWGALAPAGRWPAFAASLVGRSVGRHTMPEPAGDHYTFAGEIPWAPVFAEDLRVDGLPDAPLEHRDLGDGTEVELLGTAHEYLWESYHSVTTQDLSGSVPTRAMCAGLGLRGLPQTFDLATEDGRVVSRSVAAPAGYVGHLLYLRADILDLYLLKTGTELGWVMWGERELTVNWDDPPEWYRQLRLADADQHRRVTSLAEIVERGT